MVSIDVEPQTEQEAAELEEAIRHFWKIQRNSGLHKGRVYVQAHQTPPEGVELHRGVKGGIYYEAGEGQGEEDSPHVGTRFRDPEEGLMTVAHVEDGKAWVTDEYDEEHEMSLEELEQRISSDPKARRIEQPKKEENQPVEGKLKPGQLITTDDLDYVEPDDEWSATSSQGEKNRDVTRIAYVKKGTFSSVDGLSDTRIIMKDTESWALKNEMKHRAVFNALGWDQCPESYQTETGMAQRWVDNSGYGGKSQLGESVNSVSPKLMESFVQYSLVTAGIMGNYDGHAGNFVVDNEREKIWAIDNEFTSLIPVSDNTWEQAFAEAWVGRGHVYEQWDVNYPEDIANHPEVLKMRRRAKDHLKKNRDKVLAVLKGEGMTDEFLMQMEERLYAIEDLM